MNKIILLLFLSILIFFSKASWAKEKIYVTLNVEECHNCLDMVSLLKKLDENYEKVYVFQGKYIRDSAYLIKKFDIKAQQVYWSDSVYNHFANSGLMANSTVSLYNEENGRMIKLPLVRLGDNISFLNNRTRDCDTLSFQDDVFSGSCWFASLPTSLYAYNKITKEVRFFDLNSGSSLPSPKLTEDIIKNAYKMRYGDKWQARYKTVSEYSSRFTTKSMGEIISVVVQNDTTYALLAHLYLYFTKTDTLQKSLDTNSAYFNTLAVFKEDKLIAHSYFENYIDFSTSTAPRLVRHIKNPTKNKLYYNIQPFLTGVVDGRIVISLFGNKRKDDSNYFYAYFKKDKNNTYVFDEYLNRTLPKPYDLLGYNYTHTDGQPIFDYPYTAFVKSDDLFSLNPQYPDIEMNYLEKMWKDIQPEDYPNIWDLRVTPAAVYMIYMKSQDHNYHYLKWSRTTMNIIDKPIYNYKDPSFITTPKLDDFDPNYVYYPYSFKSVIRKKERKKKAKIHFTSCFFAGKV